MKSGIESNLWVNGRIVSSDSFAIPRSDRGFTLGDGLFETMLWTGQKVRFLEDHMARLTYSAAQLAFPPLDNLDDLMAGLFTLGESALGQSAILRVTLTRGSGPRGLRPTTVPKPLLMATIAPHILATAPVSLRTVTITRNCGAPSSLYKTLSYIDNIIALQEAYSEGADEALLLGSNGNVACASSANLLFLYQGMYLTPPISDGALPGIVRGQLLRRGLIQEATLSPAMLKACDGAFLTNAIIGIRAVSSLDGRTMKSKKPDWMDNFFDETI